MRIYLLERLRANHQIIRELKMSDSFGFCRDGVLLVEKDSEYILGQTNELSFWIRESRLKNPKNQILNFIRLSFNSFGHCLESRDLSFKLPVNSLFYTVCYFGERRESYATEE